MIYNFFKKVENIISKFNHKIFYISIILIRMTTFKNAQQKMITYITSGEFKNREDAQTTIKSIQILKKIIKYGYLTDSSQEGTNESGYNSKTKKKYYIKERAYVVGFMKKKYSTSFVNWINANTNKIAFIIVNDSSKSFEKKFYDEKQHDGISTIPVTIHGNTQKNLVPITFIHLVLPSKIINFQLKQVHLTKSDEVDYVACIDPQYGLSADNINNGIYKNIIKGLKQIKKS